MDFGVASTGFFMALASIGLVPLQELRRKASTKQ
jgi:hypothetical protein